MAIAPSSPRVTVYTSEDCYVSGGGTRVVELLGLKPGATELDGEFVRVKTNRPLSGNFSCLPPKDCSVLSSQCTVSIQTYHTLDSYLRFLSEGMGVDVRLIKSAMRREPFYPLQADITLKNVANALFSPVDMTLFFGDGEGRWHFATSGDVVVHEATHWLVHLINPTLASGYFGAGESIHEGMADIMTALFFDDPEIAEAYGIYRRGKGYKGGMRQVTNRLTFDRLKYKMDPTMASDPHMMGRVYSGFFWSLYQDIFTLLKTRNPLLRDDESLNSLKERARITTAKIALAHVGEYQLPNPEIGDFLGAVQAGLAGLWNTKPDILAELKASNVTLADVMALVKKGADFRGFTKEAEEQARIRPGLPKFPGPAFRFGESVAISHRDGRQFFQQLYRTRSGKDAALLGYGIVGTRNSLGTITGDTRGLRDTRREVIDETIAFDKNKAFEAAKIAVRTKLVKKLEKREMRSPDPAFTPVVVSERSAREIAISTYIQQVGEGPEAAELAILPGGKELVWVFNAGIAEIAISAKTGQVANLRVRGFVD